LDKAIRAQTLPTMSQPERRHNVLKLLKGINDDIDWHGGLTAEEIKIVEDSAA
jgi:hypothetical protein